MQKHQTRNPLQWHTHLFLGLQAFRGGLFSTRPGSTPPLPRFLGLLAPPTALSPWSRPIFHKTPACRSSRVSISPSQWIQLPRLSRRRFRMSPLSPTFSSQVSTGCNPQRRRRSANPGEAYIQTGDHQTLKEVNTNLLETSVRAIEQVAPKLQVVILQTGGKS